MVQAKKSDQDGNRLFWGVTGNLVSWVVLAVVGCVLHIALGPGPVALYYGVGMVAVMVAQSVFMAVLIFRTPFPSESPNVTISAKPPAVPKTAHRNYRTSPYRASAGTSVRGASPAPSLRR